MNRRWVWVFGGWVSLVACNKERSGATASGASASANAVASSASGSMTTGPQGGCVSEPEYLVPPQKYGDEDLVRAITVDAGQVYFRNMTDVFRVPLAGGTPTAISKGPGLLLSGTTVLWTSGDKLVTQSAGEPIFMESPKAGGAWKNFIDLTQAKLGGGRDVTTRILQGLGGGAGAPKATIASFDGQNFYFAEISRGKGANAPATCVVKTVPLGGGEARTLYESPGEISDVVRAGEHIVFLSVAPPSPEQLAEQAQARAAKKIVFGARGQSHLMSVPLAGGPAKRLVRIGALMAHAVLGADGPNVYASGYLDEDLTKPGIFRVDAGGARELETLDARVLSGSAFVSGNDVVLIGSTMVEPSKNVWGQVVLTAARAGKSATQRACVIGGHTLHASAVSNKTALLALFKTDARLASIAKLTLP